MPTRAAGRKFTKQYNHKLHDFTGGEDDKCLRGTGRKAAGAVESSPTEVQSRAVAKLLSRGGVHHSP